MSARDIAIAMSLADLPGIGPAKLSNLFHPDIEDVETVADWADRHDLFDALGIDGQGIEHLLDSIQANSSIANEVVSAGWKLVMRRDSAWPLKSHFPRIPWIYAKGDESILRKKAVAISGSRNASETSLKATEEIVGSLVGSGYVVVSGGARGIDSIAHETAIRNGGATVVVSAEGARTISIPDNWLSDQVLLVSEFSPLDRWSAFRAMKRNKTIVGLSDAMIVVQSGIKGGTFDAGKTASKLKVPLLVVDFLDKSHEGNEQLLRLPGSHRLVWPGNESSGEAVNRLMKQSCPQVAPRLFD